MSDLDITDNVLAELRSAADIVEVVGEHTRLKKAGRSWKGLCPFHNERTPSFTVDRDKGLYHCFGCGAGGDVIHFVRQIDRLDFPEAIEALASRFGVAIPRRVSRGPRDERREKLLAAVAAAQRFYAAELAKPGNRAAAYLEERAVPEAVARALGVGYAPAGWETLAKGLGGAWPESLLVEAGLLQPRSEGRGAYDRFRNRLVFTIRDERGRPVGFSGRALSPEDEPKYLNSPESPIFLKKRLLYALTDAREAIRRRERTVLAEGCFDHLALYLSGVEETVASMGTALTPEQAAKLKRLAPRVVVCYDGDSAGRNAARAALPHLLAQGLEVSVARLPGDEDPDDVRRREGPEAVAARIDQASKYLTWLLEEIRPAEAGLSAREKSERVREVLEIIRQIPDEIRMHEECRVIAREVSIPLEILWEQIKTPDRKHGSPTPPVDPGTVRNAPVLSSRNLPEVERRLLEVLVGDSEYKYLIARSLKEDHLSDVRVKRIVASLNTLREGFETIDFQRQIAHLTDEETSLLAEIDLGDRPTPTERTVSQILTELEKRYLDRESAEIQRAISKADSSKEDSSDLLRRKEEITRRRAQLGR